MQLRSIHLRKRTIIAVVAPTLTGLSAVIGQVVLMREVIADFNGNELSLAVVLAVWLFWTAIGSGFVARFWRGVDGPFAIAACLCALSLAPTIVAIRSSRGLMHLLPGELAGPSLIALVVFACLSVFCSLAGCMFVFAARLYQREMQTDERAASYAYLYETAGSALGGAVSAVILLCALSPLQIAVLVAFLNATVAGAVVLRSITQRVVATVCLTVAAVVLSWGSVPGWEQFTQAHMWSGFDLIAWRDSAYGRISILGNQSQRTVYQDGSVMANIPDPATAEETAHYALLEHPTPHKILLIGGGMNGSIVEALKHPSVAQIDYIELDPALLQMAEQHLAPQTTRGLSDPRVHIHAVDARLFLDATHDTFDEIILSTATPDNAQLNRFYTAEFFGLVRRRLANGGVFALSLHSSEEVLSDNLGYFLRCIHKTMQLQFPYIAAIPGDTLHLFGALQPGIVTEDPQILADRLRRRHIDTQYVREYSLPFRMMPDRLAQIRDTLRSRTQTPVNSDAHPVAYYFSTVLWCAQFNTAYARMLESLARIPISALFVAATVSFLTILLVWIRLGRSRLVAAGASAAVSGFTLMAIQILLLLSFQATYGVVYSELAGLISALMAGIAVGSWIGIVVTRHANSTICARRAAINQFILTFTAPMLLLFAGIIASSAAGSEKPFAAHIAYPLLALLVGIPGGCQFPLATSVYSSRPRQHGNLGTLYALDLAGGCIGAMLLATLLLPLFGFWNNAWLTAIAGLPPAFALAIAHTRQST